MARKVVESILDAAAMASRQDTLGDMLNQIPSILQQQQQAKEAREDRLQQYADSKAFQDKQFEETKTLSETNLDFNVVNAAMEIDDPVARAAAIGKIKPKTQDGYRYLNAQLDGTNSINTTMKEFNTNFTADIKGFDDKSYEEQKLVIEKYENQIALNPSLKGFKTQTDNLRTRATTAENKRIVQDFAKNYTLSSLSDEENRQMQEMMKNATSFEQLQTIIDIQLKGKKDAGMSVSELNNFIGKIGDLVEAGVYTEEQGRIMIDDAMKKYSPRVTLDNNKKDEVDTAGYTTIATKTPIGDTMVNTYSKTVNGIKEYYYVVVDPTTGRREGDIVKMTEQEAVAAGLKAVTQENSSSKQRLSDSKLTKSGYEAILSRT